MYHKSRGKHSYEFIVCFAIVPILTSSAKMMFFFLNIKEQPSYAVFTMRFMWKRNKTKIIHTKNSSANILFGKRTIREHWTESRSSVLSVYEMEVQELILFYHVETIDEIVQKCLGTVIECS